MLAYLSGSALIQDGYELRLVFMMTCACSLTYQHAQDEPCLMFGLVVQAQHQSWRKGTEDDKAEPRLRSLLTLPNTTGES